VASTGPAKPRLWPAGDTTAGADRLTVPQAWALYNGVLGYHLPKHLNNAGRLSQALGQVK
jgi:hypothetical protein